MTKILTPEVADRRVARGIKFLNEWEGWATYERDWNDMWSHIDLDRLRMDEYQSCILGQLFGSYGEGTDAFGVDFFDPEAPDEFNKMGFDLRDKDWDDPMNVSYTVLGDAWKRAIKKIREETAYEPLTVRDMIVQLAGFDLDTPVRVVVGAPVFDPRAITELMQDAGDHCINIHTS